MRIPFSALRFASEAKQATTTTCRRERRRLVPIHRRQEHCRVSRIASLDHAVKHQPGVTPSEKNVMPVNGFSVTLFDNVRVVFEEGNNLFTCGSLFPANDSASGLVHNPGQQN